MSQKGSAFVELVAASVVIALFLLVIAQFAHLFGESVNAAAKGAKESARVIAAWDNSHKALGFSRPCIEGINPHITSYAGEPVSIGAGAWKRKIGINAEVKFVERPICNPW